MAPEAVFRAVMEWDLRRLGGSRGAWKKEVVRPGLEITELHEGDGRPGQWCRHTYVLTPVEGGKATGLVATFENRGSDAAFNKWSRIIGERLMLLEREERERWKPPAVHSPGSSTVIVHGDYMPTKVDVRDSVINRSQIGAAPAGESKCPACGYGVAADWKTCPKCGGALGQV